MPPATGYLHLFAPEQPDLNWDDPEVHADFEDILRFWLDLGVDGFRIDVAHGLTKDPGHPDLDTAESRMLGSDRPGGHPCFDRDETPAIYQDWRRLLDSYDGDRVFVAEAWVSDTARTARYLTPDRPVRPSPVAVRAGGVLPMPAGRCAGTECDQRGGRGNQVRSRHVLHGVYPQAAPHRSR